MLSLTRKVDYALVALVYLGCRQRQAMGPASARLVAETFDLPLPVLMNTLKALARDGLVHSHRGVTGGYELAHDPAELNLLEIVRRVERVEHEHPDVDAEPSADAEAQADTPMNDAPPGPGARAVDRLQRKLNAFLEQLTLADLLDDTRPGTGREPGPASPEHDPAMLVPLRTRLE